MDKIARVGVDLAKNVMQVHAVDSTEHVVIRTAITRERFVNWFANLEPRLVAMEACSAAHFWARKLRSLGHDVCLIPPQFVAPYRKGGLHVKNDAVDAEAICEAASRPHMRFVPIKSPTQQSVLMLHRMRTGFVEERTALINRMRGLLAEFGGFAVARLRLEGTVRYLYRRPSARRRSRSNTARAAAQSWSPGYRARPRIAW